MQHQPTQSGAGRPRLRVIHGDEPADSEDRRDWTLSEFYERFVLPACHEAKDRRPRTVAEYRRSLRLWAQLTGDPPLRFITDLICAEYRRELAKRHGLRGRKTLSPNTVAKHCRHIQMVLDRAGPRSRLNRLGQGLIAEPPYVERPDPSHNPPDRFHLDEISAWMDVLPHAAALPRSMRAVDAARWWRALIIFTYNTALRINAVMEARREWVEQRATRDGGPGVARHWLLLPGAVMKEGRPFALYLNTAASLAVEMVPRSEDGRIFAWPGWPKSQSWLQEMRRRQLGLALRNPKRRMGFHGLRRCALHWLAERNPLVARKVASHSGIVQSRRVRPTGDVLADHYVGDDVVIELLDRLPQPGPAHQKRLF